MILGQLMTNEVLDPAILQAMQEVPRDKFLPEKLRAAAYVDGELEVVPGRYLMDPLTFARLLHLANISSESRVLLIGCLSGYPAAVIAKLAGEVVATETDAALITQARELLKQLGITNVTLQQVSSLPDGGTTPPYDIIFIHGSVVLLPEKLAMQMKPGGQLATVRHASDRPGGRGGLGKGLLVMRLADRLQYREYFDAGATVLPGFERLDTFRF